MIVVSVLVFIVVFFYLLVQANMDAKTGFVVKKYNNVMLIVMAFIAVTKIVLCKTYSVYLIKQMALVGAMLALISSNKGTRYVKVMQKADAKAFAIVYLSSFVVFGEEVAAYVLCLNLAVSNLFFLFWYRVVKREKLKIVSDVRKPYFPFILAGYLTATVLIVFVYLKIIKQACI